MKKLNVDLGCRSYPIFIGDSILENTDLLNASLSNNQILIVTNTTIAPLYLNSLMEKFIGLECHSIVLDDGEIYKNIDSLQLVLNKLLILKFNCKSTLVALGGGVIGDLVGFAASIYQRGVNFVQIPTTLLAQVDSSVGGKTAINHPLGKNMIGSFYQPQAVYADINTLKTLSKKQYVSGLAEVIKYGFIQDKTFIEWMDNNADKILALDSSIVTEMVFRSCAYKAEVVRQDETEQGIRAYLNLGHTFGHAIEKNMNFTGILHGEAVSIGMVMAAYVSYKLGHLTLEEFDYVKTLLVKLSLPIQLDHNIAEADMFDSMALDKKNISASIRFVLLEALGKAYLNQNVPIPILSEAIREGMTFNA